MIISVVLAITGIMVARNIYLKNPSFADKMKNRFNGVYKILWKKFFVDEFYDRLIVRPIYRFSESVLWKITDAKIIDGVVDGTASLVNSISEKIRKFENGVAQFYALIMTVGVAIALFWIIFSL